MKAKQSKTETNKKLEAIKPLIKVDEDGKGNLNVELTDMGYDFCEFKGVDPQTFIKEVVIEALIGLGIKKEEAQKIKVTELELPKKSKKNAKKTSRRRV